MRVKRIMRVRKLRFLKAVGESLPAKRRRRKLLLRNAASRKRFLFRLCCTVGQIGNLRPIGNRPLRFPSTGQADYQSAAGCHPAPHGMKIFAYEKDSKT